MSAMSGHEKANKGGTDTWLTPLPIIEALGKFDLDPCGEIIHRTASVIYTEQGLESAWYGRVWLNPPYSKVGNWLDRLHNHSLGGGTGVALVFNRSDVGWFQKHIRLCSHAFIPQGRLKFLKGDGTPGPYNAGAPSIFLAYKEKPDWSKLPMKGYELK